MTSALHPLSTADATSGSSVSQTFSKQGYQYYSIAGLDS